MGKKLYVGNLPYSMTEDELAHVFSECGDVQSVRIIFDRESGRSKGFSFVEMGTEQGAQDAISRFNGANFKGRALTVNEARPVERRNDFGGGGAYGGSMGMGMGYGRGRSM